MSNEPMRDKEITAAEAALTAADQLYDAGKYEDCLRALEVARNTYGDILADEPFQFRFGVCHYDMGMVDRAIDELSQVRRAYSGSPVELVHLQVLFHLGLAYEDIGDTVRSVEALLEAEKHIELFDNSDYQWDYVHSLTALGRGLLWKGDSQGAIERFNRILDYIADKGSFPDFEREIALYLAQAHSAHGDYNVALSVLQRITISDLDADEQITYYRIKIRAFGYLEDDHAVLSAFQKLLASGCGESILSEVYHWAGRAHYYLGHGPEAVDCFTKSGEFPTEISWIKDSNRAFLDELRSAGYS